MDAPGAGLDAVRQAVRLARPESEALLVGVSESHLASQGMLASHTVEETESGAREALDDARELARRRTARGIEGR